MHYFSDGYSSPFDSERGNQGSDYEPDVGQWIAEYTTKLIDICQTLGIQVTTEQLEQWKKFHEQDDIIDPKLHEQIGSKFIADAFAKLLEIMGEIEGSTERAQEWEKIKELIRHQTADVASHETKLSSQILTPVSYENRKTLMNTTLDRCENIDRHILHELALRNSQEPATIVDIGVGYPPITTVSTAIAVGERARVIGVDVTMPDVVVTFPANSEFNYHVFYDLDPATSSFRPRYALCEEDPQSGVTIYRELTDDELEYALRKAEIYRGKLMEGLGEAQYVKMAEERQCNVDADVQADGIKLLFQPMQKETFHLNNLEFRRDDFRLATVESADMLRLSNVLIDPYYSEKEIQDALQLLARKLKPSGLLVLACNEDQSVSFRKQADGTLRLFRYSVKFDLLVRPVLYHEVLKDEPLFEAIRATFADFKTIAATATSLHAFQTLANARTPTEWYCIVSQTENRHGLWLDYYKYTGM